MSFSGPGNSLTANGNTFQKRWDDNLVVVQRNGQGAEKSI